MFPRSLDRTIVALLAIRVCTAFGAQLFRQALFFYFIDNLLLTQEATVDLFTIHTAIASIFRIVIGPAFDEWLLPEMGLWASLGSILLRGLIASESIQSLTTLLFLQTVAIAADMFTQGNLRLLAKRHISTLKIVPAKPFRNIVFGLDYGAMNFGIALATGVFLALRWWLPSFAEANRLALAASLLGFLGAAVAWACIVPDLELLRRGFFAKRPHAALSWSALKDITLWRFAAFSTLLATTSALATHVEYTLPFVMQRTIGPGAKFAGVQIINPTLCMVIAPLFQIFLAHYHTYYVVWAGVALAVLSVLPLLILSATSYTPYVLFIIVVTLTENIWSVRFSSFGMQVAPKGQDMLYNAFSSIPTLVLGLLASKSSTWLLNGFCSDAAHCTRPQLVWLIIGAVAAIAPLGMLIFKRVLNLTEV